MQKLLFLLLLSSSAITVAMEYSHELRAPLGITNETMRTIILSTWRKYRGIDYVLQEGFVEGRYGFFIMLPLEASLAIRHNRYRHEKNRSIEESAKILVSTTELDDLLSPDDTAIYFPYLKKINRGWKQLNIEQVVAIMNAYPQDFDKLRRKNRFDDNVNLLLMKYEQHCDDPLIDLTQFILASLKQDWFLENPEFLRVLLEYRREDFGSSLLRGACVAALNTLMPLHPEINFQWLQRLLQ